MSEYLPPSRRRYGGLSEQQLEEALRALQALVERGEVGGVLALSFLVEHLDEGRSLAEVMETNDSFRLHIRGPWRPRRGSSAADESVAELRVGCFPGMTCGDEGTWRCTFDGSGTLLSAELRGHLIS